MPPLVTKPLVIIDVIKKANSALLNSVRKNDARAQVEFSLKFTERARVTCY